MLTNPWILGSQTLIEMLKKRKRAERKETARAKTLAKNLDFKKEKDLARAYMGMKGALRSNSKKGSSTS